jgi:hypothetical protein
MVVIAALFLQASAGTSPPHEVAWQARPSARDIVSCMSPLNSGARPALIKMQCVTAPRDRLANCTVIENSQAPDLRYEQVALCASKYFRIRAQGADGKPLLGVPVGVPFSVQGPPQRKAE